MKMGPAVVVTGLGMVTSIGTGREQFWGTLIDGRCGFGPVKSFDTSKYSVHLGAEIVDFNPNEYVFKLDPCTIGRASHLAIAAARLALQDASFDLELESI